MVTLTDAQQDAILNVARPLQPSERVAFMAALAELLAGRRHSLGDGELGRMLRDLQRRIFTRRPTRRPACWGRVGINSLHAPESLKTRRRALTAHKPLRFQHLSEW